MEMIVENAANGMGTILYFVQSYFFSRTLASFMEPRRNKVLRVIGFLLGVGVCTMVIFPRDVFNITFNIPLFFLMLLIGFEQKLLVKVSMVLLFFPIIITVNFMTSQMGGYIWMVFFPESHLANTVTANLMIIASMLFWVVFQRQAHDGIRRIVEMLDNKSWIILDTICLASLLAVINGVYYTPQESYKVWLCMIACLITNLSAVRLVFYLAENVRGKLEQKNAKLQQDYYHELELGQQEIRKFRHDMNNHFSVMAGLMEVGNNEEAKNYFRQMSGELRARSRSFCKNSVVNAVLNSKYNRAMAQEIDCFFHIEIDELLFIEAMDICTMFSNTLDNAIEACQKVEVQKRRISVKGRCTEQGYFSYEIENTIGEQIQVKNGKYKTWKKEKRLHGIGLENVKDVVRKYGGTFDVTFDETSFCVVILIAEGCSL